MDSKKENYIAYLSAVRELVSSLSYIQTPDMFFAKPVSVIGELSGFSHTAEELADGLDKVCKNGMTEQGTIDRLAGILDRLVEEIKKCPDEDFLPKHIKTEAELTADGNCHESFMGLKELIENADGAERRRIADVILGIFCTPFEPEFEKLMKSNISRLKEYPFLYGEFENNIDSIPYRICKIGDSEYSLYNKSTGVFSEIAPFCTERETEWFFKKIDKPIFAEEQTNIFNLEFLCDNVRASEDFSGENHIYLYYSSAETLAPLLALCDISYILDSKKIVFLIGEENKQKYPIDFKEEFGIDYSEFVPTPLRIEEINRMCFMYISGVSGTHLLNDVIHANPAAEMQIGDDFGYYVKYKGNSIENKECGFYLGAFDNPERKYTADTLKQFRDDPDTVFEYKPAEEKFLYFIDWIEKNYGSSREFTLSDLFKAFFICSYYKDKPKQNLRIVPIMHWDAHSGLYPYRFTEPAINVKYPTAITIVRDSIISTGRCIERLNLFFFLPMTSSINKMSSVLQKQFYGVHFERLKQYPDKVCRQICKLLNMPESAEMLETEAPFTAENGDIIQGYDLSSLNRNCAKAFSDFDKVRIRILSSDLDKYFGYPSFDFDECPMTYEDIKYLLKFPFRFEDKLTRIENERGNPNYTKKEEHDHITERLWLGMLKCRVGAMILPKMIDNDAGEENG